ncbi:MAG: class I SAM-dependent methyltransferase [Deltaproteobacteria bacterium]|nr:class I SAM-dependent methyltransferase [Deltaproteobacteria bacterium]
MGYVFDKEAARRYAAWSQSPQGRAMERWLESCLPGLLRPHPRERVLDIGCGEGTHLLFLKRLGLDISGLDASPHMINRARERLGQSCTLKTGRAEDLPFEDNAFDLSVMIHSLEFVENPVEALREAGRVTRRAVFVCVMNSLSWWALFRKLKPSSLAPPLDRGRFYSLWELKDLVRGTLGRVPTVWHSAPGLPPVVGRWYVRLTDRPVQPSLPFGPHLGLSATILYRFRTDNLTLRVPVRARGRTIPGGAAREKPQTVCGARRDERSLPL